VLVEEVVFTGVVNESIRVIHPFLAGCEMILGAVGFVEGHFDEAIPFEGGDGSASLAGRTQGNECRQQKYLLRPMRPDWHLDYILFSPEEFNQTAWIS